MNFTLIITPTLLLSLTLSLSLIPKPNPNPISNPIPNPQERAAAYLTGGSFDGNFESFNTRIKELKTRLSNRDFLTHRSFDSDLISALEMLQTMGNKGVHPDGKQNKLRISDKSIFIDKMHCIARALLPDVVPASHSSTTGGDFEPILMEMFGHFKISKDDQAKLTEEGYAFLREIADASIDDLKDCGIKPLVAKRIVNEGVPWAIAESARKAAKLVRTDADMKSAVEAWCRNESEACARYGHISKWDTSSVNNMSCMFEDASSFNILHRFWNKNILLHFNSYEITGEHSLNICCNKCAETANLQICMPFYLRVCTPLRVIFARSPTS